MDQTPLTYTQAIQELDTIVQAIQENRLEIDQLKSAVTRAGELIKICQSQLRETDQEIQTILATLE